MNTVTKKFAQEELMEIKLITETITTKIALALEQEGFVIEKTEKEGAPVDNQREIANSIARTMFRKNFYPKSRPERIDIEFETPEQAKEVCASLEEKRVFTQEMFGVKIDTVFLYNKSSIQYNID